MKFKVSREELIQALNKPGVRIEVSFTLHDEAKGDEAKVDEDRVDDVRFYNLPHFITLEGEEVKEAKERCTHGQNPSGAMYCWRNDGCTYPGAPTVYCDTIFCELRYSHSHLHEITDEELTEEDLDKALDQLTLLSKPKIEKLTAADMYGCADPADINTLFHKLNEVIEHLNNQ